MAITQWNINGRYMDDREVVGALISRDALVTRKFLYELCYPLFAAVYSKYYTDCESAEELINEVYVYILYPSQTTGRTKLEDFGYRCTLTMWLKVVTEHYCHQLYAKKLDTDANILIGSDRNAGEFHSLEMDFNNLNMQDVKRLLHHMPNERYARLLEYRYIDERSNEETAKLMKMSMANYYNAHLRAKTQFCSVLKHEGLL